MKTFYLLLLAIAISAVSCKTKEGEPGPAGESSLTQQGSISGILAYVDYQGNAVSIPFNNSYFETLADNKFYYDNTLGDEYYNINLFRRDLKDNNNFMIFTNLFGYMGNTQLDPPSGGNFEFSVVKIINGELFEFSAYFNTNSANSSNYTITNYSLDIATGRLTFDYVIVFDPNNINYSDRYDYATDATVTGRVDVILNREPISANNYSLVQ